MNRFHFVIALVAACCCLRPATLSAQEIRAPFTMDKQYSSEMTLTTKDGMTMNMKVYADGDKMRSEMEMNGMKMATIVRKDKLKVYQVMVAQKMIMEMDYDESKFKGRNAAAFGPDGKFELVGPDTVDGVACTKYKVTSDKSHQVYFFWLDTANKVPVKMQADDKSFTAVWKNYKAGPQDLSLFEIPSGYQVMSMPMPSETSAPGGGDGGGGQ